MKISFISTLVTLVTYFPARLRKSVQCLLPTCQPQGLYQHYSSWYYMYFLKDHDACFDLPLSCRWTNVTSNTWLRTAVFDRVDAVVRRDTFR